jgi:hypothetical protein
MNDPRIIAYLKQIADAAAKKKGWANGGDLVTGQASSVFNFQQDFVANGPGAGYYTIQFGVNAPATPFDAVATIKWKVNGQTVKRQVSLANGQSISGMCESVDVDVADDSGIIPTATLALSYRATVSAIPGNRAGTHIPPTLRAIASNPLGGAALVANGYGSQNLGPAGQSVDFVVPLDAGATSFLAVIAPKTFPPPAGNSLDKVAIQQMAATGGSGNLYTGLNPPIQFVSLYVGTTVIRITNTDAANTYVVNGTWGIDG